MNETCRAQRRHIDRKYYSIERAKEALNYRPQDNSAHFDGDERVVEPDV
jgi:NAD+ dependent glucose-6-phosphate dehydrogenase